MVIGSIAYLIKVGPIGLLQFVFFPGTSLGVHTYSVILYFLVAFLVLTEIWGLKMPGAIMFLWGMNELIFNGVYPFLHPAAIEVFFKTANLAYIGIMGAFIIIGIRWLQPKLRLSILTFVFPAFFILWTILNMPLMFTYESIIPNYGNWPWELGYQLTLTTTFLGTFRPHESSS